MRKWRWAVVLSGLAVAWTLPASAADPASEQSPSSATAGQAERPRADTLIKDPDSSKESQSTTNQGAASKGKNGKSHGPTAVMDRATPTEKSSEKSQAMQGNSVKHPPTARMDQATPALRSPGAMSSSTQSGGSESESTATK